MTMDNAEGTKDLVREKYAEIALQDKAHFSISDVVLNGALPPEIQAGVELYVGCVSGAMQEDEYLGVIHATGGVCGRGMDSTCC